MMGIKNKIYEETADNTLKDLKNFQETLKIMKNLSAINWLSYMVQPKLISLRI